MIDWQNFTPLAAASGGLLIGGAVAILLFFNGRIAGISGILGGLLNFRKNDIAWRWAFLGGLALSATFWQTFAPLPTMQVDASLSTIFVAGVLVGVGTSYASGCTSGHGVAHMKLHAIGGIKHTHNAALGPGGRRVTAGTLGQHHHLALIGKP